MREIKKIILGIIASTMFLCLNCSAEDLKIGMSTALFGSLKEVGRDMCLGFETYFDKINREGGINGHQLKLIVKDDGYEPRNAAIDMRALIDEEQVLAVVVMLDTDSDRFSTYYDGEKYFSSVR